MASTTSRRKAEPTTPGEVVRTVIEPRRKRLRIALRAAGERAGMSEGSWRQLVAGGVMVNGTWSTREPRRDQALAMAAAVGCLDEAAGLMRATPDEVAATKALVVIPDPAEEEIMNLRHLKPAERLALLEHLGRLRHQHRTE